MRIDLNLKIAHDFLPLESLSNHSYYQLHSYSFLWKYLKAESSKDIGKTGNFSSSQFIIHRLQNSMWTLKNPKAFRGRATNKDGKWPWNESVPSPKAERHSSVFCFFTRQIFFSIYIWGDKAYTGTFLLEWPLWKPVPRAFSEALFVRAKTRKSNHPPMKFCAVIRNLFLRVNDRNDSFTYCHHFIWQIFLNISTGLIGRVYNSSTFRFWDKFWVPMPALPLIKLWDPRPVISSLGCYFLTGKMSKMIHSS